MAADFAVLDVMTMTTDGLKWAVRRRRLEELIHTKREILKLIEVLRPKIRDSLTEYSRAFRKLRFNGKKICIKYSTASDIADAIGRTFSLTGRGVHIQSILGIGGQGVVYAGVWNHGTETTPVAIKITYFDDDDSYDLWSYEVDIQTRMNQQPGFRTARVYDSYVYDYKQRQYGVVVMERIAITMDRAIRYLYKDAVVVRTLCRMLHHCLHLMNDAGFVHGDFHVGNLGFVDHYTTLSLVMLDVERSVMLPDHSLHWMKEADTFFLWRSSLFPGEAWIMFNRELRSSGLPLTKWLTSTDVNHDFIADMHPVNSEDYTCCLFDIIKHYDDTVSKVILRTIDDLQLRGPQLH